MLRRLLESVIYASGPSPAWGNSMRTSIFRPDCFSTIFRNVALYVARWSPKLHWINHIRASWPPAYLKVVQQIKSRLKGSTLM
jgi:hypothetical protein